MCCALTTHCQTRDSHSSCSCTGAPVPETVHAFPIIIIWQTLYRCWTGSDQAATCMLSRRLQVLWFQYEITFGAYCFVWWEKVIVHAILLSIIFLVGYGLSMQAWALRALFDRLSQALAAP